MNPKLHVIFARRSVRAYQEKAIPETMVRDLLEAGMAAPSAVAKDPWRIVVVTRKELLQKIAEHLPHGTMLGRAPLGLIVCGSLQEAHDHAESYMLQDCSAAIENILVAAAALGLGACWLGVHPRQERIDGLRSVLNVPEGIVPLAALAVGWPAEEKEPRTRFNESKVVWESW